MVELLGRLDAWDLHPEQIVTHRFGLDDAGSGVRDSRSWQHGQGMHRHGLNTSHPYRRAQMSGPRLVAGVDSSTQSTKVLVCDANTGEVVREGRAAHPDGTEVDPEHWWQAFLAATSGGLLDGVDAIGVAGQQHGMVALDESGAVVRPALLWNDTRSADSADELVADLGGSAGLGRRRRLGPCGRVHRHQAALAGRARARVRRADQRGRPSPRLGDRAAARRCGRSTVRPGPAPPTAATRPARATGRRRRATTAPTWSGSHSAARSRCPASSAPTRPQA